MSDSMPTKYEIFNWWKDKAITKDGDVVPNTEEYFDISRPVIYDWGEPCCWCCGRETRILSDKNKDKYEKLLAQRTLAGLYNDQTVNLQRCHILAKQFGGTYDTSNLFLLCEECHEKSPDTTNEKNFIRWVFENGDGISTFKYKIPYGAIKECVSQNKDSSTFKTDFAKNAGQHGEKVVESSIIYSFVDSCDEFHDDMIGRLKSEIQKKILIDIERIVKK